MKIGLIGPGVASEEVRKLLDADWHLLDMWDEREIQARGPECAVFCLAPGDTPPSAIQKRLLLLEAQEIDPSVPIVCYAAIEAGDPLVDLLGGLGERVLTLVHRGTEDRFLQEEILEAAVRPLFWHVSGLITSKKDLDSVLSDLLSALVAQPVPRFDEAVAMTKAGVCPFVRHVPDTERLVSQRLRTIRKRARENDFVVKDSLRLNTALHTLARYDPDRVHLYRLAVRLGYRRADSLRRALERATTMRIRELLIRPLGRPAKTLLETLPRGAS